MKSTVLSWSSLAPWAWTPHGADGTDDTVGATDGDDVQVDDIEDTDGDTDDTAGTPITQAQYDELQRKFTQIKTQLSANDKSKAALQKQLDDAARKEKTDLENAKADVAKLTEEGEAWKDRYERLALTNAFLIESSRAKVQWHDPEVAQAAAGLSALSVGDDGAVDGMAEAIKKLAKEKAFLVTTSGEETGTSGTTGKTGTKVGTGKGSTGKPGQLSEQELVKRFPALRQ